MKNLNIKSALIISLSFLAFTVAKAQQIPMYAGYTVNKYLLSPSFAGSDDSDTRLMALNRLQFAGIEGAPVTFMFTADAPIKSKNMGLGATIYTDKYGLLRQTGIALGYSYNIKLSDDTRVNFGLSGEVGQLGLDFDNIVADDMTDELLNLESANKLVVNGSFGIHLTHKEFTLGFAAPQIFGTRVAYQNYVSNLETGYQLERHYMALMSYKFDVNENLDIEPIVLMRTISGLSPQFDINLKGTIKDNVFLSLGYRSDYAMSFGGGVNVSDNMMIGYSYDMAINEIAGYSFGSHEFMLGYRIYKGLDRRDMEKKIKEEREEERKRNEDLYGGKIKKLEDDIEEQDGTNRLQQEEIDRLKGVIESYGDELDSLRKANANQLGRDIRNQSQFDVNGDGNIDGLDDTNGDGNIDENDFLKDKTGKVITPKTVIRKGGSNASNPAGKYIVSIASFKTMAYAIEHQQMMKRNGDTEQTYIHQSASGTWYHVFKKAFDDPSASQSHLNSLSREGLEEFMYPWIYVK